MILSRSAALTAALLLLSSCFIARGGGAAVETTVGGNELLSVVSDEPLFYDPAARAAVVEAELTETQPSTDVPADVIRPEPGSLQVLGRAGGIVGARWKERMEGRLLACQGWFSGNNAAATCGDDVLAERAEVSVEINVTCRSDQAPEISLLSLDPRVMALRVDYADGTSLVSADPEDLGFVGLTTRGAINLALAQTDDGDVYEISTAVDMAACGAVARPGL